MLLVGIFQFLFVVQYVVSCYSVKRVHLLDFYNQIFVELTYCCFYFANVSYGVEKFKSNIFLK